MAHCDEFSEILENLYRIFPPRISHTSHTNYSDTESYDTQNSSSSDNETSNVFFDCYCYNCSHRSETNSPLLDAVKLRRSDEDDRNPLLVDAVKLQRHVEEPFVYHEGVVGNEHMVFLENKETGSDSFHYFALFGNNKDTFLDSINRLKKQNEMDIITQVLSNLKFINCEDEEDYKNITLEFFTLQRDKKTNCYSIKNVTNELKQLVQLFEQKKNTNYLDKSQSRDFDDYYSFFCPKPFCQLHIFFIEKNIKNKNDEWQHYIESRFRMPKNSEFECPQYRQDKNCDAGLMSSDKIIEIVEMAKNDLDQYRKVMNNTKNSHTSRSTNNNEFNKLSRKIVEIVDSAKFYLENLRNTILTSVKANKEIFNNLKGNENITDIINEIVDSAQNRLESYKPNNLTESIRVVDFLYSDIMNKIVHTAKNEVSRQYLKNNENTANLQNLSNNYDAKCFVPLARHNSSQNNPNIRLDKKEPHRPRKPDEIVIKHINPIKPNDEYSKSAYNPTSQIPHVDTNVLTYERYKEFKSNPNEIDKFTNNNFEKVENSNEVDKCKMNTFQYSYSYQEMDCRRQHYDSIVENNDFRNKETSLFPTDQLHNKPSPQEYICKYENNEPLHEQNQLNTVLVKTTESEENEYPLISLKEYQINKQTKDEEAQEQPFISQQIEKIPSSQDKIIDVWTTSQPYVRLSSNRVMSDGQVSPNQNIQPLQMDTETTLPNIQSLQRVQETTLQNTQPFQRITETSLQNIQPLQMATDTSLQYMQPIQMVTETALQYIQPLQSVQETTLQNIQPHQMVTETSLPNIQSLPMVPETTLQYKQPLQRITETSLQNIQPLQKITETSLQNIQPLQIIPETTLQNIQPNQLVPKTTLPNIQSLQRVPETTLQYIQPPQRITEASLQNIQPLQMVTETTLPNIQSFQRVQETTIQNIQLPQRVTNTSLQNIQPDQKVPETSLQNIQPLQRITETSLQNIQPLQIETEAENKDSRSSLRIHENQNQNMFNEVYSIPISLNESQGLYNISQKTFQQYSTFEHSESHSKSFSNNNT